MTPPGDTPFSHRRVMELCSGGSCNVTTMTTTVHVGAHVDAPLHFVLGDVSGKGVAASLLMANLHAVPSIHIGAADAAGQTPAAGMLERLGQIRGRRDLAWQTAQAIAP